MKFDVIGFDADDTLWQNELLYVDAQDKLKQLLSDYAAGEMVEERLFETEMRNLPSYGYGIKSFTLSMIETAIQLTDGKIDGDDVLSIISFAREMLTAQVQLLAYVEDTVRELTTSHTLMVITKGDLLDQESKLARSGIGDCFRHVEVVSTKTPEAYAALLAKYGVAPQTFLMVGNSLKSDILPVLALGGKAVYIPYHTTWAHETVDASSGGQGGGHSVQSSGWYELEHLGQLPQLIERLQHHLSD
jgi:putative hydrolase of the HAD superfamily